MGGGGIQRTVRILIFLFLRDSPRAEMEGKLAASQEREKELETRVEELQGYKGQLEEELLTLRDETSKQVSLLSPEMYVIGNFWAMYKYM